MLAPFVLLSLPEGQRDKRYIEMNGNIKRIEWIAAAILCCLLLSAPAQAASFDCAKASSKVEKLICSDVEISRLDNDLSELYRKTSKENRQYQAILVSEQRAWLKKRNRCANADCLRNHYMQRISEIDSYMLVMSKNDELCSHMVRLFNEDLKKLIRASDSHEEFQNIPWEPVNVSDKYISQFLDDDPDLKDEGALFDLNNDGVLDYVVRERSRLSGMRADSISMLASEASEPSHSLSVQKLLDAKNRIQIAGSVYQLSAPLDGRVGTFWLLSPFRYHDTSYLFMQSLYMGRSPTQDFAVIAKYASGRFANKEMTGNMEDICYIKRTGLNAIK